MNFRHELQGPVVTRTETLGNEVIGGPRRGADRVVALVGGAESHREERHRDQNNQDSCDHCGDGRTTINEVRPVGPESRRGVRRAGALRCQVATLLARQNARPHKTKNRREKRQGCEHRERHADRGGDRESVEEAHAQSEHAEQRNADNDAREENGTTGGIHGLDDGVFDRHSFEQSLSMARDNKEGVVDANTQADENDELGSEHRHLQHVGQHADDRGCRTESHQRTRQRHQGGEQGSEHQEQDHQRSERTNAGAVQCHLVRLFGDLAGDGHLESRGAIELRRGCDKGLCFLGREVLCQHVEGHRGEGDRLVLADVERPLQREGRDDLRDVRKLRDVGQCVVDGGGDEGRRH